jgi:hypothetical protein
MKGLVLALLWFVIFLAATVILLRVGPGRKPFRMFLAAFAATLPLYALSHFCTPPDLYVLPDRMREGCAAVDFAYGLGVYALLVHNFWDFVYAGPMGFSAGLMVDLECAGETGRTTDDLIAYFNAGEGTDRIFGRRIPNLIAGGYLLEEGGALTLTNKGRLIAAMTRILKKLICAGEGG